MTIYVARKGGGYYETYGPFLCKRGPNYSRRYTSNYVFVEHTPKTKALNWEIGQPLNIMNEDELEIFDISFNARIHRMMLKDIK